MKKVLLSCLLLPSLVFAQDDLIKKIEGNKSDSNKYVFTVVKNIENTSVKNQASSGTCWSYSTNSFLESEMIRLGKEPVDIAEIFTARCVYKDKADMYVRLHGGLSWGDGGSCHDVINVFAKYGALPQSVYSGLNYGTSKNKFGEFQGVLKGMLDAVVRNANGTLTPVWKTAFEKVMDVYLGEVPASFDWKGKTYTPRTFADQVVGIKPAEYIEFSSFNNYPFYTQVPLLVQDNWDFQKVVNVPFNDITTIIDHAIANGYTIAWATDVSEKYFSWKNGVAFVPEKNWEDMEETEQKSLFNGKATERVITQEMRQKAFDNYETTDDHGMHIVGSAKDQTGKDYYIVKNSWGEKNDYKGYLYVSKAYVQYKTTAFLVHKGAVPKDILSKIK
ncbi:MAG: aminopeptidase [Chitinophagia bacterium]|jgi:bleomycin hydrolase|nr:aminopeptidase [Chitinophagia bacterium]